MTHKKYAGVFCNERLVDVFTRSDAGWICADPAGDDIYLSYLADIKSIGKAVLNALSKSRDLSISEEDRKAYIDGRVTREWIDEKYPEGKLFDPEPCAQRAKEWIQRIMKEYKYKTKKALQQNMQSVDIEDNNGIISFKSDCHLSINSWGEGKTPSIELKIPSTSSPEVIGAAAKYAIGNCQGLGADVIRNLLFPNGQPATFEDYLNELGLQG